MALTVDQQQSNLKHFCKICRKGFGCGRALGGHMRAHGIGEDFWNLDDDEDAASDWEEKGGGGNEQPGTKRMYALRTNPNRTKTCKVCENCGKGFSSWNSFLEHGKCAPADDCIESSPVSSPTSDGDDADDDRERGYGWSKRKRSFRANICTLNTTCPQSEEEAANCLIMLSNAAIDPPFAVVEPEESSASASRDEERRKPINFIPPISYLPAVVDHKAKSSVVPKGLFECKACKKTFNSHQALGGHRASHKKVKGCFASRLDNFEDKDDDVITNEEFFQTKSSNSFANHHPSNNDTPLLMASSSSKRKSKVHECSICHRTFSSGQALGGHKRCHWITPNVPDPSTLTRFQQFQDHMERMNQIPKFDNSEPLDLKLDLNLPAPADDPARRELATEIFLQPWLGGTTTKDKDKNNNNNSQCHSHSNRERHNHEAEKDHNEEHKHNNNNTTVSMENVEDEADSKVKKIAKLSELKDMNISGSSSPWLQVGIGSAPGVGAEP